MELSQINTGNSSVSHQDGFHQKKNYSKKTKKAIRVKMRITTTTSPNLEFTTQVWNTVEQVSNRKIRMMSKILTTKKSSKGKLKTR